MQRILPGRDALRDAWTAVLQPVDNQFEIDDVLSTSLGRHRYSDDEWARHLEAVKNGAYESFRYDSFQLPIEVFCPVCCTQPRPARLLWALARREIGKFARFRAAMYAWWSPHCGAPERMDFDKELASSLEGVYPAD